MWDADFVGCGARVCVHEQISNYELGIIMPLRDDAEVERVACWTRPLRKYVLGKDEPWVCVFSLVVVVIGGSLVFLVALDACVRSAGWHCCHQDIISL